MPLRQQQPEPAAPPPPFARPARGDGGQRALENGFFRPATTPSPPLFGRNGASPPPAFVPSQAHPMHMQQLLHTYARGLRASRLGGPQMYPYPYATPGTLSSLTSRMMYGMAGQASAYDYMPSPRPFSERHEEAVDWDLTEHYKGLLRRAQLSHDDVLQLGLPVDAASTSFDAQREVALEDAERHRARGGTAVPKRGSDRSSTAVEGSLAFKRIDVETVTLAQRRRTLTLKNPSAVPMTVSRRGPRPRCS